MLFATESFRGSEWILLTITAHLSLTCIYCFLSSGWTGSSALPSLLMWWHWWFFWSTARRTPKRITQLLNVFGYRDTVCVCLWLPFVSDKKLLQTYSTSLKNAKLKFSGNLNTDFKCFQQWKIFFVIPICISKESSKEVKYS